MGGHPPMGYDVKDRKLVVNAAEAETVRWIFQRFVESRSATQIVKELAAKGVASKNGNRMDRPSVYRLLKNQYFIGEIAHKGEVYAGEHEPIIDREIWDQVHAIMADNNHYNPDRVRVQTPALLKGIIRCRHCDRAMRPTFTRKVGRLYRYYVCHGADKHGRETCPLRTVAAGEIEAVVIGQMRTMMSAPEMVVKTWQSDEGIHERDVVEALRRLEPIWEELFPVEQQRLVQLLIGKVDVEKSGVQVHLRATGLNTLARELTGFWNEKEKSA
ncbi:MAG: recombinase family protein [Magnetococcales bacterium]|nr:recombinase family protein [Magnetococcales bacterium]